jgi:transposase-like protein
MKEATNETEGGVRRRRHFDETYKRHAVELTLRGDRLIREVAAELGLSEWTLTRWRRQYAPRPGAVGPAPASLSPEQKDEEIRHLRAEVVRLQEREIVLKKSLGILSETPRSGMPGSRR